jgi:tetratricopeptide (TPR) repeat protein
MAKHGGSIETSLMQSQNHNKDLETLSRIEPTGERQDRPISHRPAVGLDANFAEGFRQMGKAYQGLEDWENALAAYSKGVEIKPGPGLLGSLSDMHRKLHHYDDALSYAKQSVKRGGRFSWTHNRLGECYQAKQQWEESLAEFTKAIEIEKLGEYYRLRARSYRELERLEEADRDLKSANELEHKEP